MLWLLMLWSMVAQALDGNDRLVLVLDDGVEVSGWFYSVDEESLTVSGDNRFTSVPLDAIRAVQRDEEPLALTNFHHEVRELLDARDRERASPPPHPHPSHDLPQPPPQGG